MSKMNNNKFWEAYKAKCLEKGLAPLYTNAEEFDKAMNEPPKPFSTDDFTPKRDIEGWHAAEEGIDDLLGGDMEDFKQVAEDAKKRSMGAEMKNVVWIRCEHCGEMKDENAFKKYKNGTFAKVCNACIGSKIRDAKAKRIEKLAPYDRTKADLYRSNTVCKTIKRFKRFIGEKVVRPVRVWLYLAEWHLTK